MDNEEIYEKLEDSAKDWVRENIIVVNRSFRIWLLFLSAAILMPILMFYVRPGAEPKAEWFQRGGALLVVFAVLAEIKANRIEKFTIKEGYPGLYCDIYMANKYESKIRAITYCSHFLVGLGTIIWGYGDVIFKSIWS